jgi:hypothetical protein
MSEQPAIRRAIAESLLGCPLDDDDCAPCPGRHLHGNASGRRDFKIILTGAPTAKCFHTSCSSLIEEFNWKLRSEIGKAEKAERAGIPWSHSPMMGDVARQPEAVRGPKRPPYDPAKLADFASRVPFPIDAEWLAARSPVAIPVTQDLATAELVLSSIYEDDERVIVFTREFSQGDFLWVKGKGSFRMADTPGVKAVPSPLPVGSPYGVWFLAQPVTGKWGINPNNRDKLTGEARMGRRHGSLVTAWRFLVIESDEAPQNLWLRALCLLPLPIVAIYTSGGRSVHALARVNARSKAEWDELRNDILPILSGLGADPASMTAVRLTRLPGCLRHGTRGNDGKMKAFPKPEIQRLLYLNPAATTRPIIETHGT